MSNKDLKLILTHREIIAEALLQEAANLSGFSGKCEGDGLKWLERRVELLKKLASAIREL